MRAREGSLHRQGSFHPSPSFFSVDNEDEGSVNRVDGHSQLSGFHKIS